MSTLDSVTQMQQRGITDTDIITSLRNQGVSPQEINDALNQAKVKSAVYDNPASGGSNTEGMQQSIMQDPSQDFSSQITQTTQTQSMQNPEMYLPQPQYPQQAAQQQQYQQQIPQQQIPQEEPQYYPETQYQDNYYQPQQTMDTDTITEIAEQIVSEKFSQFEKKTGDLVSFRNDIQERIKNLDDRLRRIESSIDKLQHAVIGKIGEFGDNTEAIHKDLDNLHNTVSKLMNPLIDNYKELKRITQDK